MKQLLLAVLKRNGIIFENDNELVHYMKEIFKYIRCLQVGDRISWWEWNSLLVRLIAVRRKGVVVSNPSDSILVQMCAAADSMRYFKNETMVDLPLPHSTSRNMVESESNTTLLSDLQLTVQALQESNNILSRRYANALLNSQNTPTKPDLISDKPSEELDYWKRKLHDAESQAMANCNALLKAKKKLDEVIMQNSSEIKDSRIVTSGDSLTEKSKDRQLLIEKEIAENKKKLTDLKALKRKRKFSTAIIKNYLRKYFFPYCKRKSKERRLIHRWTLLCNGMIAFKHLKRRQQRVKACISIQSLARGRQCRRKIKQKNLCAVKIQRVFRGKVARDYYAKILNEFVEEKARKLKELLRESANKIKNVLLQNRYRRKRSRLLEQRRQEELARLLKVNAANVIQRGSYRKLRRISLQRKLEDSQKRKLEAFLQLERTRERAETIAFTNEEIAMVTFLKDEAAFKSICFQRIQEHKRNASAVVIQIAVKNK